MNLVRMKEIIESSIERVPFSGCWLWARGGRSEYGQIRTTAELLRAHRVSYEVYVGPIPAGLWVLHKCDVPCCVNPNHLFVGTRQDNIDDCVAKGRAYGPKVRPKGLVYKRRLGYLDDAITALDKDGHSNREIGRRLGIGHHTVAKVLRCRNPKSI